MKPADTVPDLALIDRIRSASRRMVRELGFMQATLASTDYPPSAVHAILEIGIHRSLTSMQLAEVLGLEKSSVSRMVRKLIDAGELKETVSAEDARAKPLALTAKGRRTLAAIHDYGRKQVTTALAQLPETQQHMVAQGLTAYATALEDRRLGKPAVTPAIELQQGYQPGVVGRVAEMHARFYSRTVGFGQFFESLVATGMAEFVSRLDSPRNGLWVAVQEERIVGSVAIDGGDAGHDNAHAIAHLRWFIVDDGLRGAGVGRTLLTAALAYCDSQQFAATHLWTFQGLDAARRLYEDVGFVLEQERPGQQWGAEVVEQRFIRQRPASWPTACPA